RNAAINDVEYEHGFPFLAFGRVDRRQDEKILVKQRNSCEVARGVRRIERQLGQEALTRRVSAGDLFKLDQIRPTGYGVLMNAIEMRIVPKAHQFQFRGPSCRPGSKLPGGCDER